MRRMLASRKGERGVAPPAEALFEMRAELETTLRRFWQCSANDSIEDPAIEGTKNLVERAVQEVEQGIRPSLWLRGVWPAAAMEVQPPKDWL